MNLAVLQAYGRDVERLEQPAIAVGGFIVPGDAAVAGPSSRAQESSKDGHQGEGPAQEAGPPAGAWAGSSAQAAAARKAARTVGTLIGGNSSARELDELAGYYPDVHTAASSSTFDLLSLRLGLFADLPFRARLYLEVPRPAIAPRPRLPSLIPDIRAWTFWDAGPETGLPISSHHEYPDGSMCVCRTIDWIRGRDLIVDYVDFCVCWVANTLYEQLFGFYPGTQHVPAYLRRRRDRTEEYCGCGAPRRYGACHRKEDLRFSLDQLLEHSREDQCRYRTEILVQSRVWNPLTKVGRTPAPNVT